MRTKYFESLIIALIAVAQCGCGGRSDLEIANSISYSSPTYESDRKKLVQAGEAAIRPCIDRIVRDFGSASAAQSAMPTADIMARILSEINPQKSMEAIQKRFYEIADNDSKFGLLSLAGFIGPPTSKEFFLRVLGDKDPTFLAGALVGLQPYRGLPDVLSAMNRSLKSSEQDVRITAAMTLADSSREAIEVLTNEVRDTSLPLELRKTMVITLGFSKLPEARVALKDLVAEGPADLRSEAKIALGTTQ